ncbi:MAG TPA: hypothetical protein VMV86_03415 [Methanosarcinales archaeon]|nr:hypothetical protein [Methanosarcinales archaeon]
MYKVIKDFVDINNGLMRKAGEVLDIEPDKLDNYKDFVKPVKKEVETEMLDRGERAILPKPKNKGRKY